MGVARIKPRRTRKFYLVEWREHSRLTQQALADRLHVTNMTVSRWERNTSLLNTRVQAAVAEALGIEPADLWRHPDTPSADALLRDQPAGGSAASDKGNSGNVGGLTMQTRFVIFVGLGALLLLLWKFVLAVLVGGAIVGGVLYATRQPAQTPVVPDKPWVCEHNPTATFSQCIDEILAGQETRKPPSGEKRP
jgi:transcriptional regulator with XRE-family HTH domain